MVLTQTASLAMGENFQQGFRPTALEHIVVVFGGFLVICLFASEDEKGQLCIQ